MANSGLAVEFEEMGMVALIGALLIPGAFWVAKGQTTGAMVRRSLVVGAVLAGAVAFEATIDRSAGGLVDTVEGAS